MLLSFLFIYVCVWCLLQCAYAEVIGGLQARHHAIPPPAYWSGPLTERGVRQVTSKLSCPTVLVPHTRDQMLFLPCVRQHVLVNFLGRWLSG